MSDCAARWRVGGKVPINVYKDNQPVCQCQTKELAAEIVAGMNATSGPPAAPPHTSLGGSFVGVPPIEAAGRLDTGTEDDRIPDATVDAIREHLRPAAPALTRQQADILRALMVATDRLDEFTKLATGHMDNIIEDARNALRSERVQELEAALRSLRDAIGSALNMNAGPGVLEAALTHADAVLEKEKADG